MKIDTVTKQQIVKNAFLSLFIYLLPVALMFVTFLITGQRPWQKQVHKPIVVKTTIIKTNTDNGAND